MVNSEDIGDYFISEPNVQESKDIRKSEDGILKPDIAGVTTEEEVSGIGLVLPQEE